MPDHRWEVVANPDWAHVEPSGMTESACHDRSHCADIRCNCGFTMHVHESQIARVAINETVGSICKGCGDVLEFGPGEMHGIFAEMRRQGWII